MQSIPVNIRFFDVPAKESLMSAAFHPEDNQALKLKVLAKMGITPKEGEKPLAAWIRTMSEENGLDYTQPAHPAIVDAIMGNSAVSRFMFFLA